MRKVVWQDLTDDEKREYESLRMLSNAQLFKELKKIHEEIKSLLGSSDPDSKGELGYLRDRRVMIKDILRKYGGGVKI